MKKVKISKDEFIEALTGVPIGTNNSWFEDELHRERIKWNKGDNIMKKYNLGSGDILRKDNGQLTREYIQLQSTQLINVSRSIDFKSRGYDTIFISDYRDYFEWIEDKNDTHYYKDGEWKWKIDGKEKYRLLKKENEIFLSQTNSLLL